MLSLGWIVPLSSSFSKPHELKLQFSEILSLSPALKLNLNEYTTTQAKWYEH